jgi:argininosuccinate lyase
LEKVESKHLERKKEQQQRLLASLKRTVDAMAEMLCAQEAGVARTKKLQEKKSSAETELAAVEIEIAEKVASFREAAKEGVAVLQQLKEEELKISAS